MSTWEQDSASNPIAVVARAQGVDLARKRRHVVFLIRSLGVGGSERQTLALAKWLAAANYEVSVLYYRNADAWTSQLPLPAGIHGLYVPKGRSGEIAFAWRLIQQLRRLEVDCLYAVLATANIEAVLCRPFLKGARVVCSLRHGGEVDRSWRTRVVNWLERKLLPRADAIITNSFAGQRLVAQASNGRLQAEVIPNGIDTERFRPDAERGRRMRQVWQIPEGAPLIGMPARLDPVKNHELFLQAAAKMPKEVHFVCLGGGPADYARRLQERAQALRMEARVHFVGEQLDMTAAYNSLALATLSSHFEGLPNGLAEAMACGIVAVGTDVGDVARLLADTGLTVPACDAEALAGAWQEVLTWDRQQAGARARQRILDHFSLAALGQRTTACLEALLQ